MLRFCFSAFPTRDCSATLGQLRLESWAIVGWTFGRSGGALEWAPVLFAIERWVAVHTLIVCVCSPCVKYLLFEPAKRPSSDCLIDLSSVDLSQKLSRSRELSTWRDRGFELPEWAIVLMSDSQKPSLTEHPSPLIEHSSHEG